jgi:hypothetical protein
LDFTGLITNNHDGLPPKVESKRKRAEKQMGQFLAGRSQLEITDGQDCGEEKDVKHRCATFDRRRLTAGD